MHVLAAKQFEPETLSELFDSADELHARLDQPHERRALAGRHVGQILVTLFYEPSTRTRASFEFAAQHLGMGVVSTENAGKFSSAAKGETLEDTINVINEYQPVGIVLRHNETGAADRAAAVSQAAIINAGDGKGEHPTQALLDLYTIKREKKRLDNLNVVIGGDLANGRTARSLAQLLALYPGNNITFVSVPELQMGADIKDYLTQHGVTHQETTDMYEPLPAADVVYWTRLQKERLENPESFTEGSYTVDQAALQSLNEQAIILHPLPRVGEIATSVDEDPRAKYFEQAGNGMYIRMALLDRLMTDAT